MKLFYVIFMSIYLLPGIQLTVQNPSEQFEIVFIADAKYASDNSWLEGIKYAGATGINLRIFGRSFYEPENRESNWQIYADALNKIKKAGLRLYTKVNFIFVEKDWEQKYLPHNGWFHVRHNGKLFRIVNDPLHRPVFNLAYKPARDKMINSLSYIAGKLKNYDVEYITVSISPHGETEYPSNTYYEGSTDSVAWELTGYSIPEKKGFTSYLREKYNNDINDYSPRALNNSWNPEVPFKRIDTNYISASNYNWHKYLSGDLPAGKRDFLDYRTYLLKSFIDSCNATVKDIAGIRFGINFGSIYDKLITNRGFYDPTTLLENVDLLTLGDVAETTRLHDFAADYARSLCYFWADNRSEAAAFCTETNWPGYRGLSPDTLVAFWKKQVTAFYNRGASMLSISHWGTLDSPADIGPIIDSSLFDIPAYEDWRTFLTGLSGRQVKKIKRQDAVHLSCEQVLNIRDIPGGKYNFTKNTPYIYDTIKTETHTVYFTDFPLHYFTTPMGSYSNREHYTGHSDFITNRMIELKPDIISNYNRLFFSMTSYYLPDSAYSILKQKSGFPAVFVNSTKVNGTDSTFEAITGFADGVGNKREADKYLYKFLPELRGN